MDKRILVTALVSAIGGGIAGGAITYLTVKKTFAQRAQRDIDEVKETYRERFEGKRVVNVYGNMPSPADPSDVEPAKPGTNLSTEDLKAAQDFVERLGYSVKGEKGDPGTETEEETEDRLLSIYDRQETPPDDVEEVEHPILIGYDREELRRQHKPYLISHDEFHTTETEWDKSSIVYYEDDDTLTDEGDMPVSDIEYLIGEKHLDFFGLRSGDPNQVFVRNPQISTDYEVTRNLGSYTEIVLNIPKDSDRVGTRRMRNHEDDD